MSLREMILKHFNKWNDVTGYFQKGTSYYAEILSVMDDIALAAYRKGKRDAKVSGEDSDAKTT